MTCDAKPRVLFALAPLAVWLGCLSLSACTSEPRVGEACAAACEDEHSDGLDAYHLVSGQCVCKGCEDACQQSVCYDDETPSDTCLPCVQANLAGDACNLHAGLFGSGCLTKAECVALVDCLVACPN